MIRMEVPPRETLAFVIAEKTMGNTAMMPRNMAPTSVTLEMTRAMKSEVGFPGRMPGIAPLFLRRLFAISTGLYWIAT